jgi:hypothetical protein
LIVILALGGWVYRGAWLRAALGRDVIARR